MQNSYQTFLAFKNANSNSYTYTATAGSFTGWSSETIITVVNGVVVARSYRQYEGTTTGQKGPLKFSWTEDASSIGSHYLGSDPLTLDQVYDKAKNVWLSTDPKLNNVYFSVDAKGLLMSCGYSAKNCADDCFVGINITSIVGSKI